MTVIINSRAADVFSKPLGERWMAVLVRTRGGADRSEMGRQESPGALYCCATVLPALFPFVFCPFVFCAFSDWPS